MNSQLKMLLASQLQSARVEWCKVQKKVECIMDRDTYECRHIITASAPHLHPNILNVADGQGQIEVPCPSNILLWYPRNDVTDAEEDVKRFEETNSHMFTYEVIPLTTWLQKVIQMHDDEIESLATSS